MSARTRVIVLPGLAAAGLLVAVTAPQAPAEIGADAPVASDHILVRLAPAADATALLPLGIAAIDPALRVPAGDAALATRLGLDRVYRVTLAPGDMRAAAARVLRQSAGAVESAQADPLGGIAGTPNDPGWVYQWALSNTGLNGLPGGTAGADIHALGAWALYPGPVNVVVALLDTGLDATHPDLVGTTVPGWDVTTGTDQTPETQCPHGSLAAGIIGALTNNGVGMAAACPGARLMPVRVLQGCTGTEADLAAGLVWAADHGAKVANVSLQFYGGSELLRSATEYAAGRDMLVVAAAGNYAAAGTVAYPAAFPGVVAVSATTNRDQLAGYSNQGPQITLAAPGDEIYSTFYGWNYVTRSGTSMASAHVSGAAAFVRAAFPGLSAAQTRAALVEGADDLGPAGFDPAFGWGRLNMVGAARAAALMACYANCDGSTVTPVLNTADFGCFVERFAARDTRANCDGSTTEPTLNVSDFACFLARFAAGCGP